MPLGRGQPSASHAALCSEFPDLDPSVVIEALNESGGSVDVARTSLVAISWQQAGSQQKAAAAESEDGACACSEASTSSWADSWDLGLSAGLDSLAVQLGVDRIAGHLSLAAHEMALACISVLPVELAELFYEDDEKFEGEDEGAGSSEEEGKPRRAAPGLAKKTRSGGKAQGSRVHFQDDSPRAHHGLDRPSIATIKSSREPSRELSRELSREPSLLDEAISSLASLSFMRAKKE